MKECNTNGGSEAKNRSLKIWQHTTALCMYVGYKRMKIHIYIALGVVLTQLGLRI